MVINGKRRILVIEDDEEMRSLLTDFIEESGYAADTVETGSDALRKIARQRFDLIITDYRMPGLSGLDILAGIKKLQPGAHIIFITAFGSEETHRKVLERGAIAYLEKPIHLDELRILMEKIISPAEKK
jgi:DNA-binding response OmpR family regulator